MNSTSSLYSWNSDCKSGNDLSKSTRQMVPICETDFESRLFFNSSTLLKQKSVPPNQPIKNDFVVDYDNYKFKKRTDKQKIKVAKSLKSCYEQNSSFIEAHEKASLRSNYGSNLIPSENSMNEIVAGSTLNRQHSYSRNSLSPSMCSRRTGNGNNQGNFLIPDNASSRIDLTEKQPKFYSNYSLVSNMTNAKLSSLTTDYKISYSYNDNATVSNNLNRNQSASEKVSLKAVTDNGGESNFVVVV